MRCRLILSVVLVVFAVAAGCKINPATGQKEFIVITTAQEVAIGADAAPQFEKEFGGRVDDQQLQDYVAEVGGKVAAVADRKDVPYEYHLLRSDVPNAFALPGGKIYITAGLVKLMTNERQLAAVLGHETGHVAALHNVKGLQRQVGTAVLIELAGYAAGDQHASKAEAVTKVVAGLTGLRYSRADEYQADQLGVRYMTRAGYNPWGMAELLKALQDASGPEEGGRLSEMFQTHPLTSKRIDEAGGIVEKEHPDKKKDTADPNAERFLKMKKRL